MTNSEKSLEEILNALFEKVDNLRGPKDKQELERLRSEPRFQRLVEVLLEEGRRSDREAESSPEEHALPQRNMLRPRGIGSAFHGINISRGRRSTPVRSKRPTGQAGQARLKAERAEVESLLPATSNQQPATSNELPNPIRSLAIVYAEAHKRHYSDQFKMEHPDRVEAILTTLGSEGFLGKTKTTLLEARKATVEELQSVHGLEYIEFIRNTSKKGITNLPRSTYLCPGTWDAALYAAGGALMAGEIIEGQVVKSSSRRVVSPLETTRPLDHSTTRPMAERSGAKFDAVFVLTRPPGHHATADMYGGFCIFNNSAILAERLKRKGRVVILNWDVHASNGTKHIFYDTPEVLTISMHQDPKGFFPNEGFAEEIGRDAGKGYSINIPMPAGSGDEEYLYAFDAVVGPICEQYRPRYTIVECGFDAHHKDPLGGQGLTSTGYFELGRRLLTLTSPPTPMIFTLEGGYHPQITGILAHTLLSALFGMVNPKPKKYADEPRGKNDKLSYSLVRELRYDEQRGQRKGKNIQDVIKELKYHLRDHWTIED